MPLKYSQCYRQSQMDAKPKQNTANHKQGTWFVRCALFLTFATLVRSSIYCTLSLYISSMAREYVSARPISEYTRFEYAWRSWRNRSQIACWLVNAPGTPKLNLLLNLYSVNFTGVKQCTFHWLISSILVQKPRDFNSLLIQYRITITLPALALKVYLRYQYQNVSIFLHSKPE